MYHFLPTLDASQVAVDLGCGSGSFHYAAYQCRVIGIDVHMRDNLYRDGSRVDYIRADSSEIPLASRSVDVVLSHHTMEHFPDYRKTLQEINRVLKDPGLLWIAVPNGYGFDDSLYRALYGGGGHVNRFTRDALIKDVQELTRLRLKQEVDLYSGFVYLEKPAAEDVLNMPPSLRALYQMPDGFHTAGLLAINMATRIADKMLGSRLSQYGWGFVFAGEDVVLPPMYKARFNVCSKCGSGIAAPPPHEKRPKTVMGLGLFHCPNCGRRNSFVEPPPGLM